MRKEDIAVSSTVKDWLEIEDTTPLCKIELILKTLMLKAQSIGTKHNMSYEEVQQAHPDLVAEIERLRVLNAAINKAVTIHTQKKAYERNQNPATKELVDRTIASYTYISKEIPELVRSNVTLEDGKVIRIICTPSKWQEIVEFEKDQIREQRLAKRKEFVSKVKQAEKFCTVPNYKLSNAVPTH
jgi:hypothetical protein